MNILFFLTPKASLVYVYDDYTIKQALEKMERYKYSAVPIINRVGKYVGSLTEGDVLWFLKENHYDSIKSAASAPLSGLKRHTDNVAVYADTNIEDLLALSLNQNFVPVIDDRDCFIGIVTRKDIMKYYFERYTFTRDSASSKPYRVIRGAMSNLAQPLT